MIVHYLLNIVEYSQCRKETVMGAASIAELLALLCKKHGTAFCKAIFNDDMTDISSEVVILVNGLNIALGEGLNTPLNDDDTVAIFPEIMGG